MTRPTILEVAALTAQTRGIEPPTPRWRATLAYLYGLPLSDADVDELVAATKRSRQTIIEHARQTLGRRRFRQLWARIGRRGRKSATAALIAVYEALYGGHGAHLMPGEQGLVAVISKDLAGASVVTRFVKLYLDALGIKHTPTKIGAVSIIEIEGSPLGIATLASTSEAPRGFALPVIILDEFAHVATGDDYADTDHSILAGAEPAQAQFSDPLTVGISTGLGRDGVHYERVERGLGNDSEREILSVTGASWEWSSDITPEKALDIAGGDEDILLREFQGGVSENEGTALVAAHWLRCFEPREEFFEWHRAQMWIDVGERVDSFRWIKGAWGDPSRETHYKRRIPPPETGLLPDTFIGYELDDIGAPIEIPRAPRPVLWVFAAGGWTGPEVAELGMEHVVSMLAGIAREHGCDAITGDQRGAPYLQALLSRHRIKFGSITWTLERKHEAVNLLRAWQRDRQLRVCDDPETKKQGLRYKRRIVGGSFRYGVPNQADDAIAALVTCAMSHLTDTSAKDSPAPIDGAPTRRALGGRIVISGR